ncbi:hypothetical protein YPPY113_3598 [Yersinia pestis PY-113]|nr:hypothetical protein YPPY113_3598 [Yersinia pestis PY-113]
MATGATRNKVNLRYRPGRPDNNVRLFTGLPKTRQQFTPR